MDITPHAYVIRRTSSGMYELLFYTPAEEVVVTLNLHDIKGFAEAVRLVAIGDVDTIGIPL